jgi:hypothetical protein
MKNLVRVSFVLMVLIAGLATAARLEPPIRFAIIGDRTGSRVPGIYEQVVQEVERLRPDFAITVGDEIEGYSTDTVVLNQQWAEYWQLVSPLTMPLYVIPSNHDVTYDIAAPVFEHQVGKLNRSFTYRGLHFVILDVSRWESSAELPKDYLTWLIDDLKRNRNADYTFVFYHRPFWVNTLALGKPDTLHSIFRNLGVDAVFNGHAHYYFTAQYDSILYTAIGSSGGVADSGPTGIQYHYAWVTVDKDGIHIAPVKVNSVLAWDEVTVTEAREIDNINLSAIQFPERLLLSDQFAPVDSNLHVVVSNRVKTEAVNDTLRWNCPSGWSVVPATLPVSVPAGESREYAFKVRYQGRQPFPSPSFRVRLPYAQGKVSAFDKTLPVIRRTSAAAGTFVIDGNVNDPAWTDPVCRLFAPDGEPARTESTAFWFGYDADNVYLAAWCRETRMDSLIATSVEHDGPVHAEDCVGYFLQPDPAQDVAYQVYFNPLGAVFDQKITYDPKAGANADKDWNGSYEVKTTRGDDWWSLEARIPLDQFGTKAVSGQTMGLEFRRKQQHRKAVADWQVPLDYDPHRYGVLILR